MYPSGLYGTTTHELHQEVTSGNFHSHNISNFFVSFVDGGEDRASNDKSVIACVILCIFGVSIHCSAKTQPASAAHSTDSEVRTFYLATKMVQWLQPIQQNLDFQVSYAPTPIYRYSQPTIGIMKANHLTIQVKNIDVPIHIVHEKYYLLAIDPVKLKPTIQPEDIGTKSSNGPLLERHYSYIHGSRYYPLPNSNHYHIP